VDNDHLDGHLAPLHGTTVATNACHRRHRLFHSADAAGNGVRQHRHPVHVRRLPELLPAVGNVTFRNLRGVLAERILATAAIPRVFVADLNHTLSIPVDDTTFVGNCAVGSFLSQQEADFITQVVFPSAEQGAGWEAGPGEPDIPNLFAGLHYDAATCTLSPVADAGAE
jgi:hypothetical protein